MNQGIAAKLVWQKKSSQILTIDWFIQAVSPRLFFQEFVYGHEAGRSYYAVVFLSIQVHLLNQSKITFQKQNKKFPFGAKLGILYADKNYKIP